MLDSEAVGLPAETRELRREVREFLAAERAAGTVLGRPDSWLTGWDPEFSRRLAARGWVGMALPREYGGHGRGNLERYVVIEELLAAGAPVSAHWVADRQAGPSILRHGTDAQRRRYLPAIAAGECFFSIGMSEREAGSDLAAVRTRAERTDSGWRLNGTKMWTGGAHVNHYAIVLARTAESTDRHAGLSQFVVDLRAPGVRVEPIRLLSGEHTFNYLHLAGVELAEDALLGRPGDGWRQVTGELALERSGPERFLSTLPLLTALVAELRRGACGSEQHARVGRLTARLAAIRQLSLGVAAALEAGRAADVQAALVKDLGTRFEGELVNEAREILPVPARSDATRGSYPELLATAVLHSPGYTLRGGTNEILRGIITRGLEAAR
ncbi:acyl-CoA dehydrogenase family protein [Kitasatospora viridis]|uniref:Alkylation response protein AidB-like acyl-CoA dehydrogenase n=1 Tax=Kitasatospora viridis TaxID=281105 RepID=A0A561TT33_9ACTN|nr:acyl-CoA dehydrogenase family protein [Kitasatospora viridis]TWF90279.1 alkylation response protein AidB-like acyl-CoA dehydrogenase [Kitasatospora viridis]